MLAILWNPDVVAIRIGGLALHWYSMCWLVGLIAAYYIVKWLYRNQKTDRKLFDPLFLYCFVGVLAGGRLGHCLFYEPAYFLSSWHHFIEMLLPIQFADGGGCIFTGYRGLASHGGVIGMLIALWLYSRHTKLTIWYVLDNIAIAAPVTAFFIRVGNLMNSEIIGRPADLPWSFVFERIDLIPRHPGMLYEALAYAILFVVGLYIYRRHPDSVGTGYHFGLCLTWVFTARFFIEFVKEVQEAFEADMLLDMGQLLSIPFAALGIACMVGGTWMDRLGRRKTLSQR